MLDSKIKLLLIEDDSNDAELVFRFLKHNPQFDVEIRWVQSLEEARTATEECTYDLILTDLGLPDSNGLETLNKIREFVELTPIIALTGEDRELDLAAIRAGANDYIPKDSVSRPIITQAIRYSIERSNMTRRLKEANEALTQKNEHLAQMYKMSQQFVDNVSHEFRTPLTVIREFGAIIRDEIDGPINEKQKRRVSTLISRTDDLAMMVDDLLDTSRLEAGLLKVCRQEHELIDIIKQVQKMLSPRAKAKRITISVEPIPSNKTIFCDEEKFRRVLINLLVNAIKFTPVDGEVVISAQASDRDRMEITIADNGPGIPADELTNIFERFKQVEANHRMASCKGFGLGLSIARALTSLNLGSLKVASVEGEGSQFSVSVPVANIESVLRCYLDQRVSSNEAASEIILTEVSPGDFDTNDTIDVVESIDDFLRSNVTASDLVLQVSELKWLVFTCTSLANLTEFTAKIATEWDKVKRNHFRATLPEIQFDTKICVDTNESQKLMSFVRPKSTESSSSLEVGGSRKHILVVDDETDVAAAIEARLSASGYDVTLAEDGAEGLESAYRVLPDAILLDIRMPKINGLDVLRQLKSNPQTKNTPVIILSASLNDKQTVLESGASYFIQKPFQSDAIPAALKSAMQSQTQTLESTSK